MQTLKNLVCSLFKPEILATIAALAGVAYQVHHSNESGKLNTSITLYDSYLELAFENPKFAFGRNGSLTKEDDNTSYQWYVARLLFSAESIMSLKLDDEKKAEWEATLKAQIMYHLDYINSQEFADAEGHYSKEVLRLINAANEVAQSSSITE
ncbi:hypothetical protein K6P01_002256 [Vibrio parahaemolyticus]|uniref:hypothetical protein n=2 Tax=Vibrio parahaemolyticus TaxID=670 RepID=UPI0007A07465|nr:hypothetical protein [Vibrio parahaemolyticus]EGR2203915.1 hypothetical protein [Vibrio parahaemolyticus]EHZ7348844.1 hypothetical protein [Vibrio parahaemolyticus]EIV8652176.1 hypothetical protein [Vibrio parahaemolyticus]EJG0381880.1 hypothetical protein [Vibrio parahaemolyticus]EJG0400354.1 hypothetical protein [Vibrio parahaemolyticus]